MQITKNCIINGMPEDVYHNDPTPQLNGFKEPTSLSSSTLKTLMEKTEIEARMTINRLNPNKKKKSSAAMDLGSMAHDYILSNGEGLYEIAPFDNWKTKDSQIVRDNIISRGKIPLNNSTKSVLDDLKTMKSRLFEQIAEHKDWAGIFDNGKPEQSVFAYDGDIWNRIRIDWLVENYTNPDGELIENLIVDFKTTNIDFSRWEKNELWDDKYFQDLHYRRTLDLISGKRGNARFIYVVQQVSEPFLVQIFEIDKSYHETLGKRYDLGRKKFINCTKTGIWRGIMPYTAHTTPPPWVEQKWEMDQLNEDFISSRQEKENQTASGFDGDVIYSG